MKTPCCPPRFAARDLTKPTLTRTYPLTHTYTLSHALAYILSSTHTHVDTFDVRTSLHYASPLPGLLLAQAHFDYIDAAGLGGALELYDALGTNLRSKELVRLSTIGTYVMKLIKAIADNCWLPGEGPGSESVSSLLTKVPSNAPKRIAVTVMQIDTEMENKSVERLLHSAVVSGKEYLSRSDMSLVSTTELHASIDTASSATRLTHKTKKLVTTAKILLRLRQAMAVGDWEAVRHVLSSKSSTAIEADEEICDIIRMSEENTRYHCEMTAALLDGCVCGTSHQLDLSSTNITSLVASGRLDSKAAASRGPHDSPQARLVGCVSPSDRKLLYSSEVIKALRTCLTTADLPRLTSLCSSLEMSDIVDAAVDEVQLVQSAVDLYAVLVRTDYCLSSEGRRV